MRQPRSVTSHHYRRVWLVALAVCIAQSIYAAIFIARSSFVVEGRRYFCLFDDAMISMRYADNWAHGLGLVWNPGERIEGYTNFAWTLVMGVVHLLPLSSSHACLIVQILGLVTLWGCVLATVRLGQACRIAPWAVSLSLPLVGFCYFLTFFSLMGMETGLLTVLVTLAMAGAADSLRRKEGRSTPMLWMGLALLVRMDAAILLALIFAMLLISVRTGRRALLTGLALAVAIEAVHVLWRHRFYGEWLPNTYYLKATGWNLSDRIQPGISHTLRTGFAFTLCLLLSCLSLAARWRREKLLFLFAVGAGLTYQTYVGGDAWKMDRFALPALACLALLAADGVLRFATVSARLPVRRALALALTCLALVNINARCLPGWFFLTEDYSAVSNRRNVQLVAALDRVVEPRATIAVGAAGVVPYFSRRFSFDLLGKCDRYIARLPAHPEVTRAGHNKFDPLYTLNRLRPDVILHSLMSAIPSFNQQYVSVVLAVDNEPVLLCVRRAIVRRGGTVVTDQEAARTLKDMFPGSF